MVVDNAKKLNCARFVTPADIVNVCKECVRKEKRGGYLLTLFQGNDKLNLAFVADLFNKHSGLELPTLEEMEKLKKQNTSMSKILDEAEARFVIREGGPKKKKKSNFLFRLRQILADSRLAHELQQEEVRQYKITQNKMAFKI
jgi:hypothetical protein